MTESEPKTRAMSIRGIPEDLYERIRRQAAEHQRSMEAEVRDILAKGATVEQDDEPGMLGTRIHSLFADIGGAELDIPPRTHTPNRVDFSE